MNPEIIERNQLQCWKSFNESLRKINAGKNIEYYTAVAKEAMTEYIDCAAQLAKHKAVAEVPTYARNLKIVATIFLALCFNFSFAQDTIHVKKVFLNNKVVTTDSGYIIHDHKKWIVNGKTVKLYRYKKTDIDSFKKSDLITVGN